MITVLLSGGLDSTVLLHWYMRSMPGQVRAAAVDYGQPHAAELDAARWQASRAGVGFNIIRASASCWHLTGEGMSTSPVIPMRNAVLVSLVAAAYPASSQLAIGVNADDAAVFPDCQKAWVEAMDGVLHASLGMHLVAPFADRTKADIVRLAKAIGMREADLEHTVSCYRGQQPGCGQCLACKLRTDALKVW